MSRQSQGPSQSRNQPRARHHREYSHGNGTGTKLPCSVQQDPRAKLGNSRGIPVPSPRTVNNSTQAARVPHPRRHRRFPTAFCSTLRRTPPPIPPSLLRFAPDLDTDKNINSVATNAPNSVLSKRKDNIGQGRVKVLLRVCPQQILKNASNKSTRTGSQSPPASESILRVEGNRKHVTIFDSESGLQSAQRKVGVSAPKVYAFDAVFPEDISQAEVCSSSLVDVIQAVVQGADGAVFCYGHSGLGKTYTLLGQDSNAQNLGLIPCGISWLYRAIEEMKDKTKGRFSVRVSAIEVYGRSEHLKDLLKDFSKDDGPTDELCVREDPLFGTQLQNQCELRASSVEKAAYMLDAALAARSSSGPNSTEEARRHSHLVYTLHVYQYRLDKTGKAGVSGGRSRLHFIDLGSCERTLMKTPNSLTLSLNSLGHVIMAIINNSKHVPFKESKLTLILQELLGNFNCRTVMLAHVARDSDHYADTLSTVQMASRIHRVLLKKKNKSSSASSSVRGVGSGCHLQKPIKSHRSRGTDEESLGTSSGVGETSASELSCDTVVYVRPNGVPFSDRELTDNEGPPVSVPVRAPHQATTILAKITESENREERPGAGLKSNPPESFSENGRKRTSSISAKTKMNTRYSGCKPKLDKKSQQGVKSKTSFIRHTDTRQKLANHAKFLNSFYPFDNPSTDLPNSSHNERVSDTSTRRQTFGSVPPRKMAEEQVRKHSKSFSDPSRAPRPENTKPQRSKLKPPSSYSRGKSKTPPLPPPRRTPIKVTHEEVSRSLPPHQIPRCKKKLNFEENHEPTFNTLHASHHHAWQEEPHNLEEHDKEATSSLLLAEEGQDVSRGHQVSSHQLTEPSHIADAKDEGKALNTEANERENIECELSDNVSFVGGRQEPDGCDGHEKIPGVVTKQTVTISPILKNIVLTDVSTLGRKSRHDDTKSDLCRYIRELEDVLNTVDQSDITTQHNVFETCASKRSEVQDMTSQKDLRPDGMFVNINDEDWGSSDDDVSVDDNTESGDVVDVNFYCLSFTTKNPLVPLSKRSFVRQVSRKRRQSYVERPVENDDVITDTDGHKNNDECDVNTTKGGELNNDKQSKSEGGKLKRSGTFILDQDDDRSQEFFQTTCAQSKEIFGGVEENDCSEPGTPNEASITMDNSTISSPSQVLLYDSSSLEINYIKPKSLALKRTNYPNTVSLPHHSPLKQQELPESNDQTDCVEELPPDFTEIHEKLDSTPKKASCDTGTGSRKVVLGNSGHKQGAQLSLVKTDGAKATLELVITVDNMDDPDDFAVPTTPKKTSKSALSKQTFSANMKSFSPKSENTQSEASPSRRSKWGGLRRFGSKKSSERPKISENQDLGNAKSPAKDKTGKKHENAAVREVKSLASSSPNFVTKLLSPKLRRDRKSSSGSSKSSDFRYKSTNAISQVRQDIVRTNSILNKPDEDSTIGGHSESPNATSKENTFLPRSSSSKENTIASTNSKSEEDSRQEVTSSTRTKKTAGRQSSASRSRFGFGRKPNKLT